jgi:hypothetical protein
MGIFDIFGTGDQEKAAQDQIRGLNTAQSQATGYINAGTDALNSNFGSAISSLGSNFGAGANALTQNYGAGNAALTQNYGQANNALTSNYAQALQPYLTNYGQANSGVTALGNALGLNGQGGNDAALAQLRSTPGYKFQQQTLDDTVNAQAAASGMNASGNQLLALNKVNQGLADSTSNNYISQLQPFLGASNAAAGGIANVNTGLGNSLAGLNTGLGNSLNANATGLGNSLATNSANLGTSTAGAYQGLGGAVANQNNNLGQMAYSTQTGIGNANANADLAGLNASGNIIKGLGSVATLAASIFSDERLKEDIDQVGELIDGQPVYRYRYIGDNVFRIGLMAQDVEQIRPDAVTEIGGYKAVDYGKATEFASHLSKFLEAA